MFRKNNKKKKNVIEVLPAPKPDRRIISNAPDPENIRKLKDRRGLKNVELEDRGHEADDIQKLHMLSLRYIADFDVMLVNHNEKNRSKIKAKALDISSTGILVELETTDVEFNAGDKYKIKFDLPPGTMPEGFESKVNTSGKVVRHFTKQNGDVDKLHVAFEFEKNLFDYFQKKRWGYSVYTASTILLVVVSIIMLMRVESVIYFKYNIFLYFYSIIAAAFLLSRYFFGALYRNVPINPNYTPGVSIIVPCFNEEQWIQRTILSCINQDYPIDKLEVIIVDDCSTDRSVKQIEEIAEKLYNEAERYKLKERLKVLKLSQNGGKRVALSKGVEKAKHDLVVFVDSDSFLEPEAIKNLVQPFQDPKMGGVTGRTDVENKYTNSVTKMQTVRYYIAFRIMKAAESYFDSVTCLSGPLSCYRKELVVEHRDAWLNQKFLGQPATFGDDRSMTNFIMKNHRTGYQDSAICSTIVPSDTKVFLKQQMRWKRSWLRESLRAGSFIWRKEPFMALFFYIGLIVPIAAPIVVLYNFIYVPIVHNVFPTTFILGILLMALLMSFAHLLFRKSKLWIFGIVFCLFYEVVLLWQMPVAWVTFWKSTWGTRETPEDIKAKNKKARKKNNKKDDKIKTGI
ncbi:glycosyl transferase 2 family protein [Clostridium argentinense CDC 2741]|uniref:Hyaluronan synthase n=1 Tax=Clostridium argentinense CDC 2741 TaxID=1418104 RepID=A0A0C1R715_9CLOT|nr:glycosyltransferase [Clostridium argentinense]ARC85988.1 hyaluronan synthase [Clostridium argentinense]KIE46281.1 glycosyl transferase 2 family protein [Clostridium argentinense CDC 2741]NFF38922.1 glycosyltransferase [Clostridium argentinense]NFP48714.1 glycosyltransferase [Clostridium argentinense]NFP71018.1 glycosyltransferase [Clostridium argentinense]